MLSHLEQPGTYVGLLFIDFSSAFNTIVLKFQMYSFKTFETTVCQRGWALTYHPPSLCALALWLYAEHPPVYPLCTCMYMILPIKFHPEVYRWYHLGWVHYNDAYRDEVKHLSMWHLTNYLLLNTSKTKEIIVNQSNWIGGCW